MPIKKNKNFWIDPDKFEEQQASHPQSPCYKYLMHKDGRQLAPILYPAKEGDSREAIDILTFYKTGAMVKTDSYAYMGTYENIGDLGKGYYTTFFDNDGNRLLYLNDVEIENGNGYSGYEVKCKHELEIAESGINVTKIFPDATITISEYTYESLQAEAAKRDKDDQAVYVNPPLEMD
jgi:hypothetical protein